MLRLVLRADAVAYVVFGLVLLAAPWGGLWSALDLPQAQPELWTQLAGATALGIGYLMWIAPRNEDLARATAAAAGVTNTVAALVVAGWLVAGDLDAGALGTTLVVLVALAAAVFAVAELAIASRRIGPLLPLD